MERRRRAEAALTTVVATCCLLGVSTRRMEKLVETLGITRLSKPQVSVVAQLAGPGQQNIRLCQRKGLLTPDRTAGGTRQGSDSDLEVLRRISELLEEGLNLAGVA